MWISELSYPYSNKIWFLNIYFNNWQIGRNKTFFNENMHFGFIKEITSISYLSYIEDIQSEYYFQTIQDDTFVCWKLIS